MVATHTHTTQAKAAYLESSLFLTFIEGWFASFIACECRLAFLLLDGGHEQNKGWRIQCNPSCMIENSGPNSLILNCTYS